MIPQSLDDRPSTKPVETPARDGRFKMLVSLYATAVHVMRCAAIFGVVFALGAAFVVVADIVLRFFGHRGVVGSFDVVLLSVAFVANLTLPWGFMAAAHIRLDGPLSIAPKAIRALFDCMAALLAVVMFWPIAHHGLEQMVSAINAGYLAQTLPISLGWFWTPVIVGACLTIVATLLLAIRFALIAATGFDIAPEGSPE